MKLKKNFLNYSTNLLFLISNNFKQLFTNEDNKELIHDIRVSLRKLDTVLKFLLYIETDNENKQQLINYKNLYRKLFKTFSVPRDAEVQIELTNDLKQNLPLNFHNELNNYIEYLQQKTIENSIDNLKEFKIRKINNEFLVILNKTDIKKKTLKKAMKELEKKYNENLKSSIKILDGDIRNFHETRIQLKKYRYFLEFSSNICQQKIKKIDLIKRIQDKLGYCNDLSVMHSNLSAFASDGLMNKIDKIKNKELKSSILYLKRIEKKVLKPE